MKCYRSRLRCKTLWRLVKLIGVQEDKRRSKKETSKITTTTTTVSSSVHIQNSTVFLQWLEMIRHSHDGSCSQKVHAWKCKRNSKTENIVQNTSRSLI